MKQTGVTRRIDDLGRIVIPKEIRKNLRIRNNDELLINVNDDNIILSKYEKIRNDDVLNALVKSVSREIKKIVVITSKDRVIVSSDHKYSNLEISNSLISKIEKRDTFSSLIPSNVSLFNELIETSYLVKPFCVNSDVVGSIIIFSKEAIDDITVESANIMEKFLEIYLEE